MIRQPSIFNLWRSPRDKPAFTRKLALPVFLCLFLAGAVGLPSAVFAQAPGVGVIQGRLINRSPQGQSVADVPVELQTLVNGKEAGKATARTDTQGKFQFSGLSTQPTYSYQATIIYQEAEYYSEAISFAEEETTKSLEVAVWDATASDPGIKVSAAHVIVQFEGENPKVTEYYLVVNPGDKAYVGSKVVPRLDRKETLRFSLPQGAQGLQLQMGFMDCCVASENEALIDTMAVLPGAREIAFAYSVKPSSPSFTLSIAVNYPTDKLNMVVEDKGIRISSPQLSPPQSVNIDNTPYLLLAMENIKKGEVIQATLSGLSRTSSRRGLTWVGVGLIATALAFGLAYPMMRRRRATVKVASQGERAQLLLDVARLDDAFEDGKIEPEEYRQQRAQKMAGLVELSRVGRQT